MKSDAVLIWDRQGWLSRARTWESVSHLAPREKVYLANLEEALDELSSESEEDLSTRIPDSFDHAIIKKGMDGVLIVRRSLQPKIDAFPAFPVDVPSSVGSGDVFAGALSAGRAEGKTIASSVQGATAAAAVYLANGLDLMYENLASDVDEKVSRP
jgi:sugar/nucleoside kinase (ribokinase family)